MIDWDAVTGTFEGKGVAYSAYLEPTSGSEHYLVQMQNLYENLTGSTQFRNRASHPSRERQPEPVDPEPVDSKEEYR